MRHPARVAPVINDGTWNRADIVAAYTHRRHITPAEVRVIAECWPQLRGGAVLDIGVGTGRTTPYLAPAAARYLGVDYMPNMVEAARAAFPEHAFEVADARALPLPAASFDVACFSFCGLDYVAPSDRAVVFAEVRRVLRPGGRLAFSTHNLASRPPGPSRFEIARPALARNPLRAGVQLARLAASTARGYRNYLQLTGSEVHGDELAVLNDGAHDYALLTTYVTQAAQRRALAEAGFTVDAVLDPDGRDAAPDSRARDLYFVTTR